MKKEKIYCMKKLEYLSCNTLPHTFASVSVFQTANPPILFKSKKQKITNVNNKFSSTTDKKYSKKCKFKKNPCNTWNT